MQSTYFKRFRMEADLGPPRSVPQLPPGYRFVPWNEAILDVHARTKFRAFRDEVDALVFPCLASLEGCRRLMHEIRRKAGFLPDATWLIARGSSPADLQWCGTIQNVGIVPGHRGQGLGSCLIEQAFAGLRCHGFRTASLEVTAENCRAVRLYKRLGFRRTKTIYKVSDGQASDSRTADLGTPCIGVVAGRAAPALT